VLRLIREPEKRIVVDRISRLFLEEFDMTKLDASLAAFLAPVILATAVHGADATVPIVVSPSTINLQAAGEWVTVHAEIDYSAVEGASVTLNGIPVQATFADSRGDLVAKFLVGDVRAIVEPGTAELTLSGTTRDGGTFSGTDTVKVINVSGKN